MPSQPVKSTARRRARSCLTAVVGLVQEVLQRALEGLQVQMHVQDLVHRYRVGLADRGLTARRSRLGRGLDRLHLVHRPARDRQHDDERHLALGARDLQVKALVLVAEDLDVAAFKAAAADRAVVEASPVADELDDAHRRPILRREALGHLCPSMHLQPCGPTTAECTVPAGSTIRSPAFKSSSLPSSSSTNVMDPSTQYSTFSYEWLCGA